MIPSDPVKLGMPVGIALDKCGRILVANVKALLRVDPLNGQIETISSGGNFQFPLGVTVASNGDIFVLNWAVLPEVIRVNPANGDQIVISRGGKLKRHQAIAVAGDDIYVTDVATPDGNVGVGLVVHIDANTRKQKVVSEKGLLVGPVGIAVEEGGQLIVCDHYTINPKSPDLALRWV